MSVDELLEKKKERYGDAVGNMETLAELWTIWLKRRDLLPFNKKLSGADVAIMNVLFKINREGAKHTEDGENITDMIGYAKIAEKFWESKKKKEE